MRLTRLVARVARGTAQLVLDGVRRRVVGDDDWSAPEPGPERRFDAPSSTTAPEPAEAPAPSDPVWTAESLARGLGVALSRDESGWIARRGEHTVELGGLGDVEDDALARRRAWAILMGLRLGADTLDAGWEPSRERDTTPDTVYHKSEVPSVHGERMPRMLPQAALEQWSAMVGQDALGHPWEHDLEVFVGHVLELGVSLHMLGVEDAERTDEGPTKLITDATRALFYQSYKVRPRETVENPWGVIKVYTTAEGLGASRSLLLPDYDWDAARARGFASIPSRDELLVAIPSAPEHRDAAREGLLEETRRRFERSRYPLSCVLMELSEDGQAASENE